MTLLSQVSSLTSVIETHRVRKRLSSYVQELNRLTEGVRIPTTVSGDPASSMGTARSWVAPTISGTDGGFAVHHPADGHGLRRDTAAATRSSVAVRATRTWRAPAAP